MGDRKKKGNPKVIRKATPKSCKGREHNSNAKGLKVKLQIGNPCMLRIEKEIYEFNECLR